MPQLTGQLVLAIVALVAIVVLGVFGVLDQASVGGLIVGLLSGFGLGATHATNGRPHGGGG